MLCKKYGVRMEENSMYIERIIFLYAYICICVVLFDILFVIYIKSRNSSIDRKTKWTQKLIKQQIQDIQENGESDLEKNKKFFRGLANTSNLMALQKVIEGLQEDEVEIYLAIIATELEALANRYSTQRLENKAYFAYFVYFLQLGKRNREGTLDRCIKQLGKVFCGFMREESLYIKENSFKAIVSLGDCKSISNAIRLLEESESNYNDKLLCENLLMFAGRQQELGDLLMENFDKYASNTQVAILNYLRLVAYDEIDHSAYYKVFCDYLKDAKGNKEVKLAIIRYFRKYYYEPVREVLIHFVKEADEQMWELAAVAVTTLQTYSSQEVVEVVRKATHSNNWHVRFNASESLIELGQTGEHLIVKQDRYAYEMVDYRQTIKELKQEKGESK